MSSTYVCAARLIESVKDGKSLKSLMGSAKHGASKAQYALVLETLKFEKQLLSIAEAAGCEMTDDKGMCYLKLIMLYDVLFGKGKIEGGGKVKRELAECMDKLLAARDQAMQGKKLFSELLDSSIAVSASLPLYVRINEIKVTAEEGMQHLLLANHPATWDEHIPSLAVLPSTSRSVCHDSWVSEGKLVVQDKASCLPAQLLMDEWLTLALSAGTRQLGDCIDACAAPGNKTSHLAALLHKYMSQHPAEQQQAVKLHAFDKSADRAATLQRRLLQCGATKQLVKVATKDFLSVNINDSAYANVQCVLLDPSCSGSGIVRDISRVIEKAHDDAPDEDDLQNRLQKLSNFQCCVLRKAASFPAAEAIVYSTCSVHCMENEDVVAGFLGSPAGADWELKAPPRMSSWQRRGMEGSLTSEQAACVLRCAVEDGTNGFFVAVFRRKASAHRPARLPIVAAVTQGQGGGSGKKKRKTADVAEAEGNSSNNNINDGSNESRKKTKQQQGREEGGSLFGGPGGFKVSKASKKRFSRRK